MKYLFNDNDFNKFLLRYQKASFSKDKASIIESSLQNSLFTCKQASLIVSSTTFDKDKKDCVYKIYNNLIDPQNYEDILDAFSSSFSKEELRNWIQSVPVPNNHYDNKNNNFNQMNFNNDNFNNNNSNFNFNAFNNNNNSINLQILDENSFQKNLKKFINESFSNSKMSVLENIVKFYFLSCNQAKQFIESLTFKKDKINAFSILYPYLIDPQNFEEILESMTFDSEKKEARSLTKTLPSYYVPNQNMNYNNNNYNGNFNQFPDSNMNQFNSNFNANFNFNGFNANFNFNGFN